MKTQLESAKKNVFLTNRILIDDLDFEDRERYEYSRTPFDKEDYQGCENMSDEEFQQWRDENLSHDENYVLPLTSTLRYFPSIFTFNEQDEQKCSLATCLIYDRYLNQWAVGLTDDERDLSPNLLETFINLGKGIPMELADDICRAYSSYVDKDTHAINCELLAHAYKKEARRNHQRAISLG